MTLLLSGRVKRYSVPLSLCWYRLTRLLRTLSKLRTAPKCLALTGKFCEIIILQYRDILNSSPFLTKPSGL